MGYHVRQITKGKLGEVSKIREELNELEDAMNQNNRILALCELADLYGAIKAFAYTIGSNMEEIKTMADATESAFKDGTR